MKLKVSQNNLIIYLLLFGLLLIVVGDPMRYAFLERMGVAFIYTSCAFLLIDKVLSWKDNVNSRDILFVGLTLTVFVAFLQAGNLSYSGFVPVVCFLEFPILLISYSNQQKNIKHTIYFLYALISLFYISLYFSPLAYVYYSSYGIAQIDELTLGFSNPNQTSINLLFCFLVCICASFDIKNILLKLFFFADAGVLVWLIFLTKSRAGVVVVLLFVILVFCKQQSRANRFLSVFSIAVPVLFALFLMSGGATFLNLKFLGDAFDTGRQKIFLDALQSLDEIGKVLFGNYASYAKQNLHNSAISILVEFGLFALLLYVVFLVLWLKKVVPPSKACTRRKTAFLAFCMIIIYSSVEASFVIAGSFYAVSFLFWDI